MADGSGRTAILVATIGLVGVLGAALIANWTTFFPHKDGNPSAPQQPNEEPPKPKSPPAGGPLVPEEIIVANAKRLAVRG